VTEVEVKIPPEGQRRSLCCIQAERPRVSECQRCGATHLVGDVCQDAAIALGCVGLTAIRATEAEAALRGKILNGNTDDPTIAAAAEAARAAADPQPDMRGAAEYKRQLVVALVKRAIQIAAAGLGENKSKGLICMPEAAAAETIAVQVISR
jgi:aerobic carbon-monoxide dehydrogenase medium subunit